MKDKILPKNYLLPKQGSAMHTVFIVALILLIVFVATKIYKAVKAGGKAIGEELGDIAISTQTGVPKARITVCRDIAAAADRAISRVIFTNYIFWVTDDTLVAACNRVVSAQEASLVSTFFKELHGESLKDIIEGSYMVEASRIKITYRNSFR